MAHGDVRKAAVIGHPVGHSLSPRLHNYWLKKYNIAGEYTALDVKPEDFAATLLDMAQKGFVGANVTVPHKQATFSLMDECDEAAQKTGAVNTIIMRSGKLTGKNTDVYGFIQNLKSQAGDLALYKRKVVVLGAGGAARAVVVGLGQKGFKEIVIINRSEDRARELASQLRVTGCELRVESWGHRNDILANASLLVNTTSLGMQGGPPLDISLNLLPENALVADIVYQPLLTPLLLQAQARGNKIVDGLGMLLYQAQPAFEAWFGIKPEIDEQLRNYIVSTK